MYSVELYSRVRRACHVDGMSKSAAARHFGIDRKTVSKILKHAVPPGYRRNGPPARPKLTRSFRSSTRYWKRISRGSRSSGIRRSGYMSVCVMNMASPAASPSSRTMCASPEAADAGGVRAAEPRAGPRPG